MISEREIGDLKYGTHLVPLIAAVLATKGTVMELGMGDFSTPVLHEILKPGGRHLISVENDRDWFLNFIDLASASHSLLNAEYSHESLHAGKYSVILVDNAPAADRIKAIKYFAGSCEIFVVHDCDKMKYYELGKVFPMFQFIHVYSRYKKKTALLSNTIDVTKLL